jgi:hypothetical protein
LPLTVLPGRGGAFAPIPGDDEHQGAEDLVMHGIRAQEWC